MLVSVDRLQGLSGSLAIKPPVKVATTENITLSGLQTVDGVALAAGDRVLVKDQTDPYQNGIYNAASGPWPRSYDCNGKQDMMQGTLVSVYAGTLNNHSFWKQTSLSPLTGGDPLLFELRGIQTIWIPAPAMYATLTDGAQVGMAETAVNRLLLRTLDFSHISPKDYGQFSIRMPKSWDRGDLYLRITWTTPSVEAGDVVWGVEARAHSDGELLDQAFTTAVEMTSPSGADYYSLKITDPIGPVVPEGVIGSESWVTFRVYRDPDNVADTLPSAVSLLGVTILYSAPAETDD